ncbi:hypothetical protein JTL48_34810, partial [Pseudomonas aeruginosa]|nr:hypothetical protein [Pseudomonas aeruginosa]
RAAHKTQQELNNTHRIDSGEYERETQKGEPEQRFSASRVPPIFVCFLFGKFRLSIENPLPIG